MKCSQCKYWEGRGASRNKCKKLSERYGEELTTSSEFYCSDFEEDDEGYVQMRKSHWIRLA